MLKGEAITEQNDDEYQYEYDDNKKDSPGSGVPNTLEDSQSGNDYGYKQPNEATTIEIKGGPGLNKEEKDYYDEYENNDHGTEYNDDEGTKPPGPVKYDQDEGTESPEGTEMTDDGDYDPEYYGEGTEYYDDEGAEPPEGTEHYDDEGTEPPGPV